MAIRYVTPNLELHITEDDQQQLQVCVTSRGLFPPFKTTGKIQAQMTIPLELVPELVNLFLSLEHDWQREFTHQALAEIRKR